MNGLSLGRAVEGALNLLDEFNPIVAPYRRFHEKLPPKMQQTITAFMFILPLASFTQFSPYCLSSRPSISRCTSGRSWARTSVTSVCGISSVC